MGAKITFDATNRKFVVLGPPNNEGVIEIDLQIDLYSDGKEDWLDDVTYPDLSKVQFPVDAIGGQQFGAETLAVSYLILHGWTFKPYEGDHTLRLVGNIGTAEGWELVDDTIGNYRVRVENRVSSINTLSDTSFLQGATYGGSVAVDVVNGQAGTDYPIGVRGTPSNNLTDAIQIAQNRGLNTLLFVASTTLDATAQVSGMILEAESPVTTTLTINAAADVMNCEFRNVTVTGTVDGNNLFRDCHMQTINFFNGALYNCALEGTITLGGGLQADIVDCYSGVAGGGPGLTPTLNMGGSGQSLAIRNYSGGLAITNSTGTDDSSIDMASGRLLFEPTVTGGDFYVRGIANVTDNSGGTANVYNQTLTAETERARKNLTNRQELVDTGADVVMRTYDDDGTSTFEENVVTDPLDNKPNLPTGSITKRAAPS